MPIMKIHDEVHGKTVYIPHPNRVAQIYDASFQHSHNNPNLPRTPGCFIELSAPKDYGRIAIKNVSARKLKRSLQENAGENMGFLKMTFTSKHVPKGIRYVNIDHVLSLNVSKEGTATLEIDDVYRSVHGSESHIRITDEASLIALQMKRIVDKLEQDEELCCAAPPEEEDDSEE